LATRKKKGAASRGGAGASRALPDPGGDSPFAELTRDQLSVFLYVALLPEEARAIVKSLHLSVPGFRTDALNDVELCDAVADEVRARPEARSHVVAALRSAFRGMPLPDIPLDPPGADDLLAVGTSDHGLTYALWRVLADPDPEVRARAAPVLDRLAKDHYGPAPDGARAPRKDDPAQRIAELEAEGARRDEELRRVRAEAQKAKDDAAQRVETARKKAEEGREKLQAWLKEARAREAVAVEEAARAREQSASAERGRERAEAALAAVQATDAAAEAQRARAAARELEGKVSALEARVARQAERERELTAELDARDRAEESRPVPAAASAPEQDEPPPQARFAGQRKSGDEPEEAPASWLMPVYTREFYDSLDGWDRRIQRAAFKQAHLLAQDHRHPSLRALPLEGLPGYYRVRVATDVRLLYRRGDRQNTIEILSLIDREDLDRYVRQAKTR
jgi:mRNA-degrading endonuclease RelE of RelBE toxin-antitoxin system